MNVSGVILAILFCSFILTMVGAILFLQRKIRFTTKHFVSFGFGILPVLIGTVWLPQSFQDTRAGFHIIGLMALGFLFNGVCERWLLSKFHFLDFLIQNKQKHDCSIHDMVHTHYHFLPKSTACSAVACFVLCSFFDGMRFATPLNQSFGHEHGGDFLWVALGLMFHLLPECLTLISIALSGPFYLKNVLSIVAVFYLSFVGGAFMFLNTSSFFFHGQAGYFAFATGLFLYICVVHLIPTVIKGGAKKWFALGVGFGVVFLHILPHGLGDHSH